jgi:hypothetical protein
MAWYYSSERCGWEHDLGGFISDQEIAETPEKHPYYKAPSHPKTIGEQILGFAYDSPEAKRQLLAGPRGHLYYEAVAAVLRARRS